jgi:DNA replication and repair protein RecF
MIRSVKIQNFRKHKSATINFGENINIIYGTNGSGKTSIIEAVYTAMTGRSWRSNFESITKQNTAWWRADIVTGEDKKRTVKFKDDVKSFEIDGKESRTIAARLKLPVVLFEPDHLNLLYGSPNRRRKWLDDLITSLNPEYGVLVRKFERVLKQRNSLLKNAASINQLFVWDLQFADLATQVIRWRQDQVEQINSLISSEYQKIAGNKEPVAIRYSAEVNYSKQKIIDTLQQNHNLEVITCNTSIGPQRHDVLFTFKNLPAKTSASRGENRTIILALKNIEYRLKKDSAPLILLDDILGEFDEDHQKNLLRSFKDSQVIITCVKTPKNIGKANLIGLS